MKKITLSLSVLLVSLAGFAQISVAESNSVSTPANATNAILFDQSAHINSGILSGYSTLAEEGIWCADDFTLTSNSAISKITAFGFQNEGTLADLIEGYDLYIYADDGGVPAGDPSMPGTGVFEALEIPVTGGAFTLQVEGGSYNMILDVAAVNGGPLELAPGTYWVVASPRLALGDIGGDGRWNWYGVEGGPGADAHIIEDGEVWTSFTDYGFPFDGLAFLIEGDILGVNQNIANLVSIFPNPASDVLNVKMASSIEVSEVAMYDVLGKKVGVSYNNGKINISGLAQGVYVLKVNTNAGTLTQKVIKQ